MLPSGKKFVSLCPRTGIDGWMRPRVARILVATLCATAMSHTPRPADAQGWAQPEFAIGSWEDPLFAGTDTVTTRATYQQAKDAYFNLLTGTVFHSNAYGTRASCLMMSGEVGLHALITDSRFTMACCNYTSPTFDPTIPPTALPDYAGLPALQNDALWGYTMWDEPAWNATNTGYVKGWAAAMHADDVARNDGHHRAVYLNFQPGCGSLDCFPSSVASFVSDPDPARQVDVASVDLYPFSGSTSNPTYSSYYFLPMRILREQMGTRPFWIVSLSYPGYTTGASIPDANQLRFMMFAPIAAGAKGILWFVYRSLESIHDNNDAVVNNDRVPTCVYASLKTINHFVHDVVGPTVMSSTYLGTFHQAAQPTFDAFSPDTDFVSSPYATGRCPVSNLGDPNLMVGVWQAQSGDNYLLIVNKALSTKTATVSLRASYTVTQSASVVGYVGGTSYLPVTTGTSFAVSLSGGEGRMYRLTASPTQDFALTSPLGGQAWLAGTARQITWQPSTTPVTATVFPDPATTGSEISGPSVTLGTGLSGGQATLTMPIVESNRARLVLSTTGTDGVLRRVSHGQPFQTAFPPNQTITHWTLGSGHCYMAADLTVAPNGSVHVIYRNSYGTATYQTFDGSAWSAPAQLPGFSTCVTPSVAVDYTGVLHMAYVDQEFEKLLNVYQWSPGGAFNEMPIENIGQFSGNTAMVRGPGIYTYLASNLGSSGAFKLRVYRTDGSPLMIPYGYAIAADNPRSISIAADVNDPWVAYIDGTGSQTALHVVKNSTSPVSSLVLTGAYGQVALAMDVGGNPLVAYSRVGADGNSGLYYRSSSGGTWGAETLVDATIGSIESVSLALWNGAPRIAYAGNGVLKYAMQASGVWILDTLDGADDIAGPLKLVFAPNGNGWVSCFDQTTDNLRVTMFTPDITSPATIALSGGSGCYDHIFLSWFAPGDDGTSGTASGYDLRWSSSTITEANFNGATSIPLASPLPSGSSEQATVSVPYCSAARYYAIKARDEAYNWSALSNVVYLKPACPRPPIQCDDGPAHLQLDPTTTSLVPSALEFSEPTPNPVSANVLRFRFGVPNDLAGADYDLSIFDVAGRRLTVVARGRAVAGYQTLGWASAGRLGRGLYFARLRVGSTTLTKSIVAAP